MLDTLKQRLETMTDAELESMMARTRQARRIDAYFADRGRSLPDAEVTFSRIEGVIRAEMSLRGLGIKPGRFIV